MGVMRVGAMPIMVVIGKRGVLADLKDMLIRLELLLMGHAHLDPRGLHGGVFRRDSRERLNRKAQCQQQDDEESAANRHKGGV